MRRRRTGRRLPIPDELVSAPELAILGALEATIDLAIVALVAAQPELHATRHAHDAVTTAAANHADLVITKAQALAAAIAAYRITRDLPF
jgi:hypothetical protein